MKRKTIEEMIDESFAKVGCKPIPIGWDAVRRKRKAKTKATTPRKTRKAR